MFPTVAIKGETLNRVLDVFETSEYFMPTLWGNSEKSKYQYDRGTLINEVSSDQMLSEIYLRRNNSNKFEGRFSTELSPRSFLNFKFDSKITPSQWSDIFDLSDKLAEIIKPSYGVAHVFWPIPEKMDIEYKKTFLLMDYCAQPTPVDFVQSGPAGVAMRTYFSGKVKDLFGDYFIQNIPAKVTKTVWGGIRIDLDDEPWKTDISQVLYNFKEVMGYLEQKSILAIPEYDEQLRGITFSPNISWKNRKK
ncbi:hypothetical protein MH215_03570 [Paenibacillus sp. ACRSA]|uniref:hypothetical protein n=1 Tax=Paenibacillus sp. ACRSA TaxID=2918211 RepID=UPI001EF70F87|nr:hypothetical protein [Paenibacillus sp. ACRSA]MCG7376056.1 hypothetical protein [Paenibacillus sp. ACRSA]